MALNAPFAPAVFITNADGSVINTDPLTIPSSVPTASLPASVAGVTGIQGQSTLASLINALYAEGVISTAAVTPGTIGVPAAGAALGASPPANVKGTGSNDQRGTITFGSGTSPVAGDAVVVTFGTTNYAITPRIMISPNNTATQALGLYVSAKTATGFTVGVTNAPGVSQANTTYSFDYHVIA